MKLSKRALTRALFCVNIKVSIEGNTEFPPIKNKEV